MAFISKDTMCLMLYTDMNKYENVFVWKLFSTDYGFPCGLECIVLKVRAQIMKDCV